MFSSIEPPANINDVCVYPESGEYLHPIFKACPHCLNSFMASKRYRPSLHNVLDVNFFFLIQACLQTLLLEN